MLSCAQRSVFRHIRAQLRSPQALRSQQSALARLVSSLAILEQREGKLNHASLSAVTAAQKLAGSITGLIAGSGVKAVAGEAAKVKGVEKIIVVENGAYDKACGLLTYRHEDVRTDSWLGSSRELRSYGGREYKKGRIHTRLCWPFGIWQKSYAQSRCPPRCPTDLGYNEDRKRR